MLVLDGVTIGGSHSVHEDMMMRMHDHGGFTTVDDLHVRDTGFAERVGVKPATWRRDRVGSRRRGETGARA